MTKKKGPGRCTGHCCRCVTIAKSPEDLRKEYELPAGDPRRESDIDTLYPMLIYLGNFPSNPLMKIHGESWAQKALRLGTTDTWRENDAKQHFYTCRHVEPNGDCGIYDARPEMCRRYPNGDLCDFEDCTMPLEDQIAQISTSRWVRQEVLGKIKDRGLIPPSSLVRQVKKDQSESVKLEGELVSMKPEETTPSVMGADGVVAHRLRRRL